MGKGSLCVQVRGVQEEAALKASPHTTPDPQARCDHSYREDTTILKIGPKRKVHMNRVQTHLYVVVCRCGPCKVMLS